MKTNTKTNTKRFFLILTIVGIVITAYQFRNGILSNYTYERRYSNLWELADKSSTIQAKQQYITSFVNALKIGKTNGEFADYNALFLKTPNNSFSANLSAVETLSSRLIEIQSMDPKTFEYNTAIQQITAQEQGEARKLVGVFQGCYYLNNYFSIWDWIGNIITTFGGICLFFGAGFYIYECIESSV